MSTPLIITLVLIGTVAMICVMFIIVQAMQKRKLDTRNLKEEGVKQIENAIEHAQTENPAPTIPATPQSNLSAFWIVLGVFVFIIVLVLFILDTVALYDFVRAARISSELGGTSVDVSNPIITHILNTIFRLAVAFGLWIVFNKKFEGKL